MSDEHGLRDVQRHRRSISQLIASMDECIAAECVRDNESQRRSNSYSNNGVDNHAMVPDYCAHIPQNTNIDDTVINQIPTYSKGRINNDDTCSFVDVTSSSLCDDELNMRVQQLEEEVKETNCMPDFPFSIIDSEYDETLAFPDSVTILSNVGDKPVLVRRKSTDDDDDDDDDYHDYENDDGNSLASDNNIRNESDINYVHVTQNYFPAALPFTSLYGPSVKFNSFQRKVFIPGTEIQVRIVDTERSVTTHLLNPNLYTIELRHGQFTWTIKRRYKHFNNLHQQLSFFRTSLNIPFPIRSHKEKRATVKCAAIQLADEANQKKLQSAQHGHNLNVDKSITLSSPKECNSISTSTSETSHNATNNIQVNANSISTGNELHNTKKKKKQKKKKKRKLPRFPNRPESLVTVESLPLRIRQLEDYLYNLLNISLYRSHHETLNFVEVSNLSFVAGLGIKGKEGAIQKRTGSTRPGQAGCNFFGCFQQKCCVRCNYFCSDVLCGKWRNRWFFVKETCFGYMRPSDGAIRAVILFDQGFDVSTGIYQTGMRKGLQVLTYNRHIILKCWTRRKSKEWMQYLKRTANTYARDFTSINPHMSFAPLRPSVQASWYVDGCSYMDAVANGLEAAAEEIYIADWWLSPEIYMKRPAVDGDYWRLDKILLRKAMQGVRVFVLLYKEVEMAIGINSYYSKQRLVNLHENIKVIRHPDHARAGVFFWAHHEKIVVIDQTYAFFGGLDLCYGRWDDYHHRLTDLGSVISSSVSTSQEIHSHMTIKDDTDGDTTIFTSQNSTHSDQTVVHKSVHFYDGSNANEFSLKENIVQTGVELRVLSANENLLTSSSSTNACQLTLEGMKLNTPEMERKNVIDKLKDNAMRKARQSKNFVHRWTMTEQENCLPSNRPDLLSNMDARQLVFNIDQREQNYSTTLEIPSENNFYGQAKYWFGKDYSNFIMKDWMNLNAPLVDMIDRTTTPRMPWHDVGVCVQGAAARDVARHFIQRWNAIKLEKMRDNVNFPYLLPKSYHQIESVPGFVFKHKNRVTCQVLRSASSWSCGFMDQDIVEQSIHDAYIETISKAQHYIYIENQFFITMQIGQAGVYGNVRNQIGETLFKRIVRAYKERKKFRVYIVIPLLPGFEGDVGGSTGNAVRAITHWNYASISRGRSAILTRLKDMGIPDPGEYISFHSLRTHSVLKETPITELIYVHSKLLIADDRVCICGSANINDRSMIGKRDSEIAAIFTDEEFEDGCMNGQKYPSGRFAGGLRKFLFKEHLGLLHPNVKQGHIDITDPVVDRFWNAIWRRISTHNTEIYDQVFKCVPTNAVKSFADLRKYQEDAPLCKTDAKFAAMKIANIQGYLVDLPLEFLSTETLTPPGTSKEGLIPTSVWT